MGYEILRPESLQDFLYKNEGIRDFFEGDDLEVSEIGDGNLNFVFVAKSRKNPEKSLIVKQAVPYLRCAGEDFPLSRERMTFEIRALREYERLSPEYAPKIYHSDEEMSVVVMQHLKDHLILRKGLIKGIKYCNFAEQISTFLAKTLFFTSSLYLSSTEKRRLMDRFNQNTELCKLTEDFVFTFPYMEHETNFVEDMNKEMAENLFSDMEFKKKVLKLKYLFMSSCDALLHGDLHTGSIMANEKETFVIDPEFAFFGPFGFDIGALIANMANSYISHSVLGSSKEYREWILDTIEQIWEKFESKFLELWREQQESALIIPGFIDEEYMESFRREFMEDILKQSMGFAGCKMARRVFGIAGVEEIRGIENEALRKEAQRRALQTGVNFVKNYENITGINDLTDILRKSNAG
ncbi:S-methyl-5-thioribose kinase [Nitrosophilus alvini]|uniref:S-methyl-5-thioribose kinase n=1 Tax=Nitrosophilus alvini TaxID=2714855 RepID=UPI00190C5C07|nr:S-methyl-5-thioribose kinase [Nitrosophilus alvini]